MNRAQQRGDGGRHRPGRDGGGQDERQRTAEQEASDWTSESAYQPSGNQRRDEPMPASHHDDLGQGAVVREEEHADDAERAQPSPRAPSRRGDRRSSHRDRG